MSVTSGDSATADGRGAGGVVGSGAGGAGGVDGPEGKAVPVAGRVLFTSAQAAKVQREGTYVLHPVELLDRGPPIPGRMELLFLSQRFPMANRSSLRCCSKMFHL